MTTLYQLTAEKMGVAFGELGDWVRKHGEKNIPQVATDDVLLRIAANRLAK